MANLVSDARAIRDAAPAIRSFCLLFTVWTFTVEMVVSLLARRIDSEPLRAVHVALMFFSMAGGSMALLAWSIASSKIAMRVPLTAAAIIPFGFVAYLLIQLPS